MTSVSDECLANIFARGDYLYLLSDNQTNANDAQSICEESGGTLAEIQDCATQSDFIEYAARIHLPSGEIQ